MQAVSVLQAHLLLRACRGLTLPHAEGLCVHLAGPASPSCRTAAGLLRPEYIASPWEVRALSTGPVGEHLGEACSSMPVQAYQGIAGRSSEVPIITFTTQAACCPTIKVGVKGACVKVPI